MSFERIIRAVHEELEQVKQARIQDPSWFERYDEIRAEQNARMRETQLKRYAEKKPSP